MVAGTGSVGHRVPRSAGAVRFVSLRLEPRLHRGSKAGARSCRPRTRRGALPAPDQRSLGDDPSSLADRGSAHMADLVLARPSSLGATTNCAPRRVTERGGTPARSAPGHRRSRPPRAGLFAITVSTDCVGADLQGSGWRCWTSMSRAQSCAARTSGSPRPPPVREERGDVNKVVFPTGWVPTRRLSCCPCTMAPATRSSPSPRPARGRPGDDADGPRGLTLSGDRRPSRSSRGSAQVRRASFCVSRKPDSAASVVHVRNDSGKGTHRLPWSASYSTRTSRPPGRR